MVGRAGRRGISGENETSGNAASKLAGEFATDPYGEPSRGTNGTRIRWSSAWPGRSIGSGAPSDQDGSFRCSRPEPGENKEAAKRLFRKILEARRAIVCSSRKLKSYDAPAGDHAGVEHRSAQGPQ